MIDPNQVTDLALRVRAIEERFGGMTYDLRGVVQSEFMGSARYVSQAQSQFGVYTAFCLETIDIWKQGRVRFFCPYFHDPKEPITSFPWAWPISSMGGFDDCGLVWVPPAGSTVCLLFEAGHRNSPYYVGTTWQRDRGKAPHAWGTTIEEYDKIWEGHRVGYLCGPDDGSQCLPQWNTENYNGFDLTSIVDFDNNPEAQRRITYPNIFGFKTPEKHMLKMVDGDPKCNRRWKRIELQSGCGNWMIFKDDHLHYGGQWSHPECGVPDADVSCIEGQGEGSPSEDISRFKGLKGDSPDAGDQDALAEAKDSADDAQGPHALPKDAPKKEKVECEGDKSNSRIIGGHPSTPKPPGETLYPDSNKGANPYFKHRNECRPYKGPQTPQNNKCQLPQSGIQFLSISGHTFVMDDSVEEPFGVPEWERSTRPFDFGCNNHYVGKSFWKSATGHLIELNDIEEPPAKKDTEQLRGEDNGILLLSATGNKIHLRDHTVSEDKCPGCPPNMAGEKRGIFMQSTSNHTIEMHDETNEQCAPCRMEGGVPVPKSKKAFIKIRSGYGLEIMMADENSQEETVKQYIQIFCPQKDNKERGPHIHRYQEAPSGPGLVFLRVGGNYIISTYDNKIEVIGDEEKNPSDKMEIISRKKLVYTKDYYINITKKTHVFLADELILLLAGKDCPMGNGEMGPCVGPVAVYVNGCLRLSDRVFASASKNASPVSIFMLTPLVECPTEDEASPGDSSESQSSPGDSGGL